MKVTRQVLKAVTAVALELNFVGILNFAFCALRQQNLPDLLALRGWCVGSFGWVWPCLWSRPVSGALVDSLWLQEPYASGLVGKTANLGIYSKRDNWWQQEPPTNVGGVPFHRVACLHLGLLLHSLCEAKAKQL